MVRSLLNTTENTRELGGYITKTGKQTRCESILRSDVQNYPSEEDIEFLKLKNITTIIDMRGQKDVDRNQVASLVEMILCIIIFKLVKVVVCQNP